MQERLQKIIARAGIASRRAAEELIARGRVRVNGRTVTELGAKADARKDRIELDGRRIDAEDLVYVVLHKPRGCVSTLDDPQGRETVASMVEAIDARIYPVGRLDYHTSGVLLMTNDGDFSQGLLHPRQKVPKTYVVKLSGMIDDGEIARWRAGMPLDDGRTLPADVRLLRHERGKSWLEVTLYEGRNQQIRRMAETSGFEVMRLARVAFAGVTHEGLTPGRWRTLTVDELKKLKQAYGVPKRVRSGPPAMAGSRAKAERSARSGTRPRGAGRPSSPARGRARR